LVDLSFELRERSPRLRKALRHVEPVEEHCVVARKELLVVLERPQAKALDLRVGRVDVHHVDLARRDCVVREAVVQARWRWKRPAVRGLQTWPAVGATDEFLRETELEIGMLAEVAERADTERLRAVVDHRERIAVGKAQRYADAEPHRRERAVQLIDAGVAV